MSKSASMTTGSRVRRAIALLTTLLLAAAGAVVPSAAASAATVEITGTVVLGAGYEYDESNPPYVSTLPVEGSETSSNPVAPDGSFTLFVESGDTYWIEFSDYTGQLVGGYYTTGGALIDDFLDATDVAPGGAPITLRPKVAASISGSITFPDDYELPGDDSVWMSAYAYDDDMQEWNSVSTVTLTGAEYRVGGLLAGTDYLIGLTDDNGVLIGGYLTDAGTFSWGSDEARRIEAPATGIDFTARTAVSISGTVTFPEDFVFDAEGIAPQVWIYAEGATTDDLELTTVDIAENGGYTVTGLQSDTPYQFYFRHFSVDDRELVNGWVTEAGTVSPEQADAGLFSGPATDVDFTTSWPVEFVSTPAPEVRGTLRVGATMRASTPTWEPAQTNSYQWYYGTPDGERTEVPGGTSYAYKIKPTDYGKRMFVTVTGSAPGYTSVAVDGELIGKVLSGTLTKQPTPRVSGTGKVGRTLTIKPGTWDSGVKLTYQWFRNGKAISGATKSTYKLRSADKGKKISYSVTAKKYGYGVVVKKGTAVTKVKK